ncbi:MAG: YceD family protein [Steroidobacteraceae bacterium]
MSQPWSKPLDVDRLSRGAAALDFDLALRQLPRLSSRAELIGGSVRGRVRFGRDSGQAVAEVSLEGAAQLQCQRCMRPMEQPLSARVRVALLADEAEAGAVPEALEPVLARDGRISIAELIEEEVLLSLPIVPMHAAGEPCAALEAAGAVSEPAEASTQRPFARLDELLSHK